VVRALVAKRLQGLPLKSLQLVALELIDADQETLTSWSRDAVIKMLVDGDTPSVDLMILAEAAWQMIRAEAPEHELNLLASKYELQVVAVDFGPAVELKTPPLLGNGSCVCWTRLNQGRRRICGRCLGLAARGALRLRPVRRQGLYEARADCGIVRQATGEVEKAAKVDRPRVANPEAEEKGWQAYLKTGSLKEAALQAGVPLNTIKTWMKPPCKSRPSGRGWKARREAELAKK